MSVDGVEDWTNLKDYLENIMFKNLVLTSKVCLIIGKVFFIFN